MRHSNRRNRHHYPASFGSNLKRLLVLTPLLAVLDAAAIVGTLNWFMKDSFSMRAGLLEARNGT